MLVETDVVISAPEVLKGSDELKARKLVITEIGGTFGSQKHTPTEYDLMLPGETYVLFLSRDDRPDLPAVERGAARFHVEGVWAGKLQVVNGKIRIQRSAPPGIRQYDGATLDTLLASIRSELPAGAK